MIKTRFSSNSREFLIFISLIIVTQYSPFTYAQYLSGPVSQSLGGAGLAANDEAEQLLLNPAVLVHSHGAAVGYYYSDGYKGKNEHDSFYGATATDNTEDVFISGGVAAFKRRRTFDNFSTLDEIDGQISFAKSLFRQISLGATIEYLQQDAVGGEKYTQVDATLGLLWNPLPVFAVGFVARNLAPTDTDIPEPIRQRDELGVGIHYIALDFFRFRLDIIRPMQLNPEKDYIFKGGIESLVDAYLAIRIGVQNDGISDRHIYSAGFGFVGPRLKIDYSYVKNAEYSGGAMHSVDFRLPF